VSLLVLDTSAIAAGSIDVGEPIAKVHSYGGWVVVPVVCLIEAARQIGDDMPRVLIDNPACKVSPLTEELWAAVTAGVRILGRLDLAVALLSATMGRRLRVNCGCRSVRRDRRGLGHTDRRQVGEPGVRVGLSIP
jgi:hypothetical protein